MQQLTKLLLRRPGMLQFSEISDVSLVSQPALPPKDTPYKPIIAISGANSKSKSVAAAMAMVRASGGVPMFISNFEQRCKEGAVQGVAQVLSQANGVIILGNDGDINPARYGEAPGPHTKIETDLHRAAFEEELIRQAVAQQKPLLGICGGMQRLVAFGGALHQHVPDLVGHEGHAQSQQEIPPFVAVQQVALRPGSKLATIAGAPEGARLRENSFHHQAAKIVPKEFIVSAVSQDGIAEAIEPAPGGPLSKQFVMGVQWHPEFGASDVGPALMREMVGQSRRYAHAHGQEIHPMAAEVQTLMSSLPDLKLDKAKAVPTQAVTVPSMPAQTPNGFALRYTAQKAGNVEAGIGA